MADLFYGYDLKSRGHDIRSILEAHSKKFGTPPYVIALNKLDSESIGKDLPVPVVFERWVLPNHCFAGIQEIEDEKA